MSVIIEGPDGSGKDVLIETLGYHGFKLKALRGGVGGTEAYDNGNGLGDGLAGWAGSEPALAAYKAKVRAARGLRVAFNRFHLSEAVYGPILRGSQELSVFDLEDLKSFLWEEHVPVILCLPSFVTTLNNVKRPGRERPAYQTEEFLRQAYDQFYRLRAYATYVYDFNEDPKAEGVKRHVGV